MRGRSLHESEAALHPPSGSTAVALTAGLLLALGTFVFDLSRPVGVVAAVPYVAAVLAGLVTGRRGVVLGLAMVTSVLTVIGYLLAPGDAALRTELINRGLAVFAIWSVAAAASAHLASQQRWRERLATLATEDPVTGLPNRRFILDQLFRQIRLVDRYRQPFSVALLDIDEFKAFNDRYGHQTGDEILLQVARLAAASTRDSDQIGRFGGEEFLVLLPSTRLHQARRVGERIRQEIERFELWRGGDRLRVTVSIGIAECPVDGVPVETLLHRADEALYRAKHEGRNRVVCHEDPGVSGTLKVADGGKAAL